MKILYFIFISLLLYSCSQNKEEASTDSKKEIDKDTLPRIELKFEGEEQVFSIHEIPEFDTVYTFPSANCTKCDRREIIVLSFKNNPPIEPTGLGGYIIDSSFQGILVSYPTYRKGECYSAPLNMEEYRKKRCEDRKLLPEYKGKSCDLKTEIINGYEAVRSMDATHKYLHSMSVNIINDSANLTISGFWKKNNSELKNKILNSIYSFK